MALLVALGVLVAVIGLQKPDIFFLPVNLLNIGQAITMIRPRRAGADPCHHHGWVETLVGSIVGLTSIIVALAMKDNNSLPGGIVVGLLVGAFAGLINGLLITEGKIEPVIATLGTLAVFRGAAFIVTSGRLSGS